MTWDSDYMSELVDMPLWMLEKLENDVAILKRTCGLPLDAELWEVDAYIERLKKELAALKSAPTCKCTLGKARHLCDDCAREIFGRNETILQESEERRIARMAEELDLIVAGDWPYYQEPFAEDVQKAVAVALQKIEAENAAALESTKPKVRDSLR